MGGAEEGTSQVGNPGVFVGGADISRGCVNNGATWEEVEAVEELAGRVMEEVRCAARAGEARVGRGNL